MAIISKIVVNPKPTSMFPRLMKLRDDGKSDLDINKLSTTSSTRLNTTPDKPTRRNEHIEDKETEQFSDNVMPIRSIADRRVVIVLFSDATSGTVVSSNDPEEYAVGYHSSFLDISHYDEYTEQLTLVNG